MQAFDIQEFKLPFVMPASFPEVNHNTRDDFSQH
jgi:hypothetical protein